MAASISEALVNLVLLTMLVAVLAVGYRLVVLSRARRAGSVAPGPGTARSPQDGRTT